MCLLCFLGNANTSDRQGKEGISKFLHFTGGSETLLWNGRRSRPHSKQNSLAYFCIKHLKDFQSLDKPSAYKVASQGKTATNLSQLSDEARFTQKESLLLLQMWNQEHESPWSGCWLSYQKNPTNQPTRRSQKCPFSLSLRVHPSKYSLYTRTDDCIQFHYS